MERLAPGKTFVPVPGGSGECGCNTCPFMRRNTLENLYRCLRDGRPLLELDEPLRVAALKPLERMLELTAQPAHGD
jgi:quinolinate synthase